jgi:hypothetical protein
LRQLRVTHGMRNLPGMRCTACGSSQRPSPEPGQPTVPLPRPVPQPNHATTSTTTTTCSVGDAVYVVLTTDMMQLPKEDACEVRQGTGVGVIVCGGDCVWW